MRAPNYSEFAFLDNFGCDQEYDENLEKNVWKVHTAKTDIKCIS